MDATRRALLGAAALGPGGLLVRCRVRRSCVGCSSKDERYANDKAGTRSTCCRLLTQSGRCVKREDKVSSFNLLVAGEATVHQRPTGYRFAILEVTKSPSAGRGVPR